MDQISLRGIIIDFVCLFTVAIPILMFKLFGVPYQRGFFCDDDSIMYPYHPSTVTNVTLYVVGLFLPVSSMILIETIRYVRDRKREGPVSFYGYEIPMFVVNCYKCIGIFGFGAASSQMLTDVGKYSIGRLRPHFLDICKPDIDCKDPAYMHVYIEDFTCKGTDVTLLKDARLSFPSGHSSFSAYSMIFLILFIQYRFHWKGSFLLKHVLQFLCLLMIWGTALSRVSNYKHHWSDVLVGLIIGTVVSLLTQPFVFRVFRRNNKNTYIEANNGASLNQVNNHHS